MARILFFSSPERSHTNATFGLAKSLAGRGHDVAYLTTADLESHVRAQGIRPIVVLQDVMPKGTQSMIATVGGVERPLLGRLHARIGAGALDGALREEQPDLLLADTWMPTAAFAAHRLGIRVVMTSPTLPRARDPMIPGAWDFVVPDTPFGRARLRLSFMGHTLRRSAERLVREDHALGFRAHAVRAGYPPDEIDTSGGFPRLLAFPEIVLCPRAFDLPRSRPLPNIHCSESFVDTTRHEPFVLDDSWLCPERPLVYVSFGTVTHRNPKLPALVGAVVEGLQSCRVPIQAIVSASARDASLARADANVRVVHGVPQLEVLRRSALMINHGGLNSIKECIEHAVPMLVIPWAQPVNAVRVAYHRIGRVVTPRRASADAIRSSVEALLTDARVRERMLGMRDAFRAATEARIGASVVEAQLR